MARQIKLTADRRTATGSSAVRKLRRAGRLPAVVYGSAGARPIAIDRHAFERILGEHASENLVVDLDLEGEGTLKVLLKEVQHGPVFGEVLHADFLEISMTEKMRVTIPVTCVGEPVGVSQQGGILEHLLREVEVECLPGDLVESFVADVSGLKLGGTLLVRDLAIDARFTVLTPGDMAVATVVAPRVEAEAAPEAVAAEAAAAAEPEVIGKKKEAGAEGEEAAEEPAAAKGDKREEKKGEKAEERKEDRKR